jgi:hypothetical protein
MSEGFGVDTWCLDSLAPGRYARGSTLVAQAIYRRLITPRGTLQPLDDETGGDEEGAYGFDVSGYCGAVGYDTALFAMPGQVRNEIKKDDRVSEALVTATMSEDGAGEVSITLSIDVTLAEEGGDFTLTLGVSSVSVAIIGGLP